MSTIAKEGKGQARNHDTDQDTPAPELPKTEAPEPELVIQSPTLESKEARTPGDEEAQESEHARIDRLGREKPAKFKSFARELAFCYSIIASQFMAVSNPLSYSSCVC